MNNIIERIKELVYERNEKNVKNITYKEYVWKDKQELLYNNLYSAISGVSYEMIIETTYDTYTVAHFTQYNYYDHDDKLITPEDDNIEYGLTFVDRFNEKPHKVFFEQYINYVQKYSAPLFPFIQSKLDKADKFKISASSAIYLSISHSRSTYELKDVMLEVNINEYDYFIYIHNFLRVNKANNMKLQHSREHYINKVNYKITNKLIANKEFIKTFYILFNNNNFNIISCADKEIIPASINAFLLYASHAHKKLLQLDYNTINIIDKHILLTDFYIKRKDEINDSTSNFSIEYFEKINGNYFTPIDLTDYSSMLLNDYAETVITELLQIIDEYVDNVFKHLDNIKDEVFTKFNMDLYTNESILKADFNKNYDNLFVKLVNHNNYDSYKEYFNNISFKDASLSTIYMSDIYGLERDEEAQFLFIKELFDKEFEFMMFIRNIIVNNKDKLISFEDHSTDEDEKELMSTFYQIIFKELCKNEDKDYVTPMFDRLFKKYDMFISTLYVYNVHIAYLFYMLVKSSKNSTELESNIELLEEYFDNAMNSMSRVKLVKTLSYDAIIEFVNNKNDYSEIAPVLWLDFIL